MYFIFKLVLSISSKNIKYLKLTWTYKYISKKFKRESGL